MLFKELRIYIIYKIKSIKESREISPKKTVFVEFNYRQKPRKIPVKNRLTTAGFDRKKG
jgi:hypothetical protein